MADMDEFQESVQKTLNQQRRDRRKRQRDRLKREVAERTGERNRARADRNRLADYIDEVVPGIRVDRGKSGQWTIVADTD